MKAWTLIGFYLLKDIWKRWFETPGGVLSRLLVAFILGLLLLVIDAAFSLSAASIQSRISQLGIRTIVMSRPAGGSPETDAGHLAAIADPLSSRGQLLRLLQIGASGVDEFGGRRAVYLYGNEMLDALAPALPVSGGTGALLVSDDLPPGMPTAVSIGDFPELEATVIQPPSWLSKFGAGASAILVPEDAVPSAMELGFYEIIVFLGEPESNLMEIEDNLRTLLTLEDLSNVQIASPKELLAQLDELESTQSKWQGGFGLFGGIAVALVFGSIAILEYRQNRFIIALLKSFGAPSTLLIARYLAEAVILVVLAAMLARAGAIFIHPYVFSTIGLEPNLIDRVVIDPYEPATVWGQLRWLGLGALLSVLPVIAAIRTPVGKILA